MGAKILDASLIIGKKYNRLTILEYYPASRAKRTNAKVLCLCDCGNIGKRDLQIVRNGRSKSCGCSIKDTKKYYISHHAEYRAWSAMKQRCTYENRHDYHRYGGRGIKVCDKWMNSFENFLEDMGAKPSKELSLDRIDNNGNYEPGNCRWATLLEQNRNKTYYRQGRRTTLICNSCKKEFSVKNSKALGRKYCSDRCYINKRYNQL